jgi:hypothetical protein
MVQISIGNKEFEGISFFQNESSNHHVIAKHKVHYYQGPKKCAKTLFCAANRKSVPWHKKNVLAHALWRRCSSTKNRREVICRPHATFIALDLHHQLPPAPSHRTQTSPTTSAIILSC